MILQALGTVIAMGALRSTWRQHGDARRFVPRPSRPRWLRLRGPSTDVTIEGTTAQGTATADAEIVHTEQLPEDASMETIMRVFAQRSSFIVGEHVDRLDLVMRDQVRQLSEVDAASRQGDAELMHKVTDIAVGSVRAQMLGLIFVGAGTVLSYWA